MIRSGGYILTNNHVISVAAGGGTLSTLRTDGKNADATIVGRDPLTDLAVIRSEAASDLRPITLGESRFAPGGPTGRCTRVAARADQHRDKRDRECAQPGNSGRALVDSRAHLVGINTAGAALSNTPTGSIGLGFAIPIDLAEGIASELITAGKVTRPSLGIQVQTISKELAQATGGSAGLFVQGVTAGGPADKAGLRPGDVIVEIDGEPANSADILIAKTLQMKVGDVIHLTYERLGASHTTALTLSAG